MNKSLALKNKLSLFFLLVITLFIFFYLFYFLINGERGIISYLKIIKHNEIHKADLLTLNYKNEILINKIKRLQTNTLDLDFLDQKIRENTGFIDNNELIIKFD